MPIGGDARETRGLAPIFCKRGIYAPVQKLVRHLKLLQHKNDI